MYITKQDSRGVGRHAYPRKVLKIRCSEIASEAIFGQKQSHSSSVCYMARGVLYQILAVHAKPADIKFPLEKVLWLTEQQME